MADLKATFGADFQPFMKAAQDAETHLNSFQGSAAKVQTAIDKMVGGFQGTKFIQDAILMAEAVDRVGGVSKLTANELATVSAKAQEAAAKLRAMGQDVPEKLQSIADAGEHAGGVFGTLKAMVDNLGGSFVAHVAEGILLRDVVREVIEIGKQAFQNAAKFEDLSKATGLSTTAIQEFSYVGKEFGVDTEQMAKGVEQLSAKLANGDANATKAVEMLGLSVKDLLAAGPQEAFLRIAEAAGKVEDPMQKNAIAADLFGGRLGKQLIPMLGELRGKLDEAAKSGAIMSDETVKAAHDFQVGWDRSLTWVEAKIATLVGAMINYRAEAARMASSNPELQRLGLGGQQASGGNAELARMNIGNGGLLAAQTVPFTGALVNANNASKDLISTSELLNNRLKAQEAEWANLTAANKQSIDIRLKLKESDQEIAAALGIGAATVARYKEAHQQADAEIKKFQAALDNLMPVLTSPAWDGSIDSALKLGGAVHDVAVYFGESEGAVRKHQEAMKDWDKIVGIEATKSVQQLDAELRQMGTAVPQSFFTDMDKSADAVIRLEHGVALTHGELTTLGEAAKPSMESLYQELTKSEKVVYKIQDAFNAMPSIMMQAFQGGGNLLGAVESLGTKLSESLFGQNGPLKGITSGLSNAVSGMTSGLGSTISGVLGKAVGGMLPVIGGLVGPVMDWIMSIGGPSKDELAARSTFDNFQKQFGTLQQTIDGVGAAYAKAGKTGVQAQQDLQRALDATHVSAEAEKEALEKINGVLDAQKKYIADVVTAGSHIVGFVNDVTKGLDPLAGFTTAKDALGKTAPGSEDGVKAQKDLASAADAAGKHLHDMGLQAVGAFAAAVASGQSEQAALQAIHPSILALEHSYQTLGLKVNDVALNALMMRDSIVTSNPDLIGAVSGLSGELDALNTMGLLNVDTLGAIERTGAEAYDTLRAKVKDLGGTDNDALSQMQGFLHSAADAAKNLGLPLDDNTRKLIDQSEKAGIWQDAITPQDKLLKGMQDLVDKVQALVDKLNGIPPEIHTTVTTDYIDRHTTIDVPSVDASGYASTGGFVTPYGIQHFAGGGVVGADNRMIAASDGEVVLNDAQQKKLLGLASGGGASDWTAMAKELRSLRQVQERIPDQIAAAVTSAMLKARVGRR